MKEKPYANFEELARERCRRHGKEVEATLLRRGLLPVEYPALAGILRGWLQRLPSQPTPQKNAQADDEE